MGEAMGIHGGSKEKRRPKGQWRGKPREANDAGNHGKQGRIQESKATPEKPTTWKTTRANNAGSPGKPQGVQKQMTPERQMVREVMGSHGGSKVQGTSGTTEANEGSHKAGIKKPMAREAIISQATAGRRVQGKNGTRKTSH